MPSNSDSGTKTATAGGTRDTLATISSAGNYLLKVDTKNMVLGDEILLEIYDKVLTGSTSARAYSATYAHVQDEDVKISIPISTVFETIFYLTQEAGTARSFEWAVVDMS